MFRNLPVISADSHLEVTPDLWTDRVAERYRDYAPRRVKLADGTDGFLVEGRTIYRGGMNLFAGSDPEVFNPQGLTWDRPGTKGPEDRLKEMDADGVDAEVIYPGVGGLAMWGGIREVAAYLDIVRAYNEYLGEEYCAADRQRIIALGVIPERGLEAALAELEHCASLGLRGVNISRWPSGKSFPTGDDDRFFARALELGMPVTIHVTMDHDRGQPAIQHPRTPEASAHVADPTDRLYRYAMRGAMDSIQFVMSGLFDRFPDLRIYFAENQIGWVPIFFEQADHNYTRHHFWAERLYGWPKLTKLPSEYLREHCYWGFFNDLFGVRVRNEVGIDRIMWGSDFPHVESDWPHSGELLERHFDGVSQDECYKLVAKNAIDFFHLDEWAVSELPPAETRSARDALV